MGHPAMSMKKSFQVWVGLWGGWTSSVDASRDYVREESQSFLNKDVKVDFKRSHFCCGEPARTLCTESSIRCWVRWWAGAKAFGSGEVGNRLFKTS